MRLAPDLHDQKADAANCRKFDGLTPGTAAHMASPVTDSGRPQAIGESGFLSSILSPEDPIADRRFAIVRRGETW